MSQPSLSNLPGYEDLAGRSNLTNSQLLIWLGQRLNPASPLYNMAMRFDISGPIDYECFRGALGDVVRGNDAMRSVIEVNDDIPQQRVLDYEDLLLEFIDLSSDSDKLRRCDDEIAKRITQRIDLSRKNFDTVLIKLEPSRYTWFFNQHHLFTDIKSIELIFKEVSKRYNELCTRGPLGAEAPMKLPQFTTYAAHGHRKQEQSEAGSQGKTVHHIPLYNIKVKGRQTPAYRVETTLTRAQSQRLEQLASQHDFSTLSQELSLFNLIITAFSAYLYRISGKDEITIGCPVHNRTTLDLKNTIGLFIEMFPFQLMIDPDDTFTALHEKVAHASYEHLKLASSTKSSVNTVRGYNIVVNYITAEFRDFAAIPCKTTWLHNDHIDPQHDLRFQIMDLSGCGELKLCFDLKRELMEQEQGVAALSHFVNILGGLLSEPESKIAEVRLPSETEATDLIRKFSNFYPSESTQEDVTTGDTVLTRFKQLALESPEAVAATDGSNLITYAELDRISDSLARIIFLKADKPEMIGVCATRSFNLLFAILATLKSGAAFVPLDPAYPDKRLHKICKSADLNMVLTDDKNKDRLIHLCESVLEIDGVEDQPDVSEQIALPEVEPGENAYVIFTSGSTGEPKGVIVQHEALLNYVDWAAETYCDDISSSSTTTFPLYSSIGFDLTLTSIFVPLSTGGSIRVYPRHHDTLDLSVFDVVQDDEADVIKLTPAHLSLLAGMNLTNSRAHTLILGGEDLTTAVAEQARKVFKPDVRIFNEYGPTEAVVGCMIHKYNPQIDKEASVPIGRPAKSVNIYLLDAGGNPVPEGVIGEIWIGGERLSAGYYKQPDLTKERFRPDPFLPKGLMYKTGDLARVNSLKQLTFLGRKDTQVKIRGVRIETAEISQAVKSHPLVADCHVAVLEPSRATLAEPLHYCRVCGLASNYPGVSFDHAGKCNHCQDFESYRDLAARYFRPMSELRTILEERSTSKRGKFDVMMLLSGGKDSTYALYQICAMGFNVFAMTLDNGYISDGAKANISRSISDLGIEHEFVTSAAMNEIFSDSLTKHSSVCYGCFKTIYTLAINNAHQRGIPVIITGLSRGQMFETRLTKQVFEHSEFDPDLIDHEVLEARKVYHRIPDKVTECIDMSLFASDEIFEKIHFVDFYRYCDVSMEEMYSFLEKNAPWTRPEDTGRSTNCLINDTGIFVHKNKMGYHNYALPYSWDVRLGHKQREAALEELNDQIDASRVHEILQEIDFKDTDSLENSDQKKLVIYYTGSELVDTNELRAYLLARLPEAMVPSYYVHVDCIPLTTNGKVDQKSLPDPRHERPKLSQAIIPATTETEKALVRIWSETLRINQVGIYDNFFDLGGDSITAIQIVVRAGAQGISITPNQLFYHQNIHQLANAADSESPRKVENKPEESEPFSLVNQDASVIDNLSSLLEN